jgi:hypothetical protein
MSANRRNGRVIRDMTLDGISDAELLAIVDDVADENGWATTFAIRYQLGEDPWTPRGKGQGRTTGVGIRLAWLRRYGWLEKGGASVKVESEEPEYGWRWSQSWRLTAMGHALLDHPELSRAVEKALDGLNPAQRLRMVRELGEAGYATAPEVQAAMRRQWQRSMKGHLPGSWRR